MKIYLTLFLIGHALAGLPSAQLSAQIQADKLKHNEKLLPIVVQQRTANTPGSGIRILRQQPTIGYQYPQPTPSFFLPTQPSNTVQAVTLPQTPSPPSTVAPTSSVVPTLPPSSYLPPFPTVAPSAAPTAAPTTAPTPAVIIEPIRPVTIPAFIAPATSPPQFIAPATTAPIIIEPIRPVTIPAFIAPATSAPPTAAPSFVAPVTAPPAFIAPATTAPASIAPLLPVATQSPISFPPRPTVGPLIDASSSNMALMPQLPQVQMAQIVKLDVDCAKESMVVKIKFDRPFGGLIYSKGFHGNLDCHYVRFGTNRDSYEFIVRLNSCGSQWVDQLATGGKAYLENVIIIQNEPGIQEIWDTSRSIRCFWEGSLEKTVTYAFNIDMLDTQIVSFSGDSATASMDIQIGKGPFAPSVNGLVKIGDTLTMVVAIEGDPGFDVQVQECIAHDGNRTNAVTLTDKRGCVLKKKLMGPWQKSTETGRPGVSLIAFSFFQAFKFPDQMEVFLECNVELCKNGCDVCPDDASLFDVRSRTRRQINNNTTNEVSDVRLRRSLRVISNEDIAYKPDSRSVVTLTTGNRQINQEDVCMSLSSFVGGLVVILIILVISCVMTALLCVKIRSASVGTESIYPPSSYHAFSSSASKA